MSTSVGGKAVVVGIIVVASVVRIAMRDRDRDEVTVPQFELDMPDVNTRRAAVDLDEPIAIGAPVKAGLLIEPKKKANAKVKNRKGKPAVLTVPLDVEAVEVVQDGPDGSVVALTTQGLAKLGCPELVVRDVPSLLLLEAEAMLFATVDAIAVYTHVGDDSTIAVTAVRDDGEKETPVTLQLAHDGDRIAVVFPGAKASVSERVVAALAPWREPEEDEPTRMFTESPEIMRAKVKAHAELRDLKARWAKHPTGESLFVSSAFRGGLTAIYLVLEVDHFEGDRIIGTLTEQPPDEVRGGFTIGSRIETTVEDVLDYLWIDPDGTQHGGKVEELIDKQMNKGSAAQAEDEAG